MYKKSEVRIWGFNWWRGEEGEREKGEDEREGVSIASARRRFRRSTPTASFSLSHVSPLCPHLCFRPFRSISPPRSRAHILSNPAEKQFKKTKQASFWTVRREEFEGKNKGKKIGPLLFFFFSNLRAFKALALCCLLLSLFPPYHSSPTARPPVFFLDYYKIFKKRARFSLSPPSPLSVLTSFSPSPFDPSQLKTPNRPRRSTSPTTSRTGTSSRPTSATLCLTCSPSSRPRTASCSRTSARAS